MRGRYRRRTSARYGTSGHSMFFSTGWLFADLLLALALAFLLATTVGTPPKASPGQSTPSGTVSPSSSPSSSPSPSPSPTGHPQPALDFGFVDVKVTINPYDVLAGKPSAIDPILAAVAAKRQLKGRVAGLVLLFAGDDNSAFTQWLQLDQEAWDLLHRSGKNKAIFNAVPRDFQTHGGPSSEFDLQIYLFRTP